MFADQSTGLIDASNIKQIAMELRDTMNQKELIEMLERASSGGTGISREDFYNILSKKTY